MPNAATPKTAPTRRELSHARILDVAAREVRRKGYDGVGVADVMKQAGLTHGGFYAHFHSREAMLAAAIEHASRSSGAAMAGRIASPVVGVSRLGALVEHYLSDAHLARREQGCVVAALASDITRLPGQAAAAAAASMRRLIALVEGTLPSGVAATEATTIAATLIGSLQIARALDADSPGDGKAVLAAARSSLLARYEIGDTVHTDNAAPPGTDGSA